MSKIRFLLIAVSLSVACALTGRVAFAEPIAVVVNKSNSAEELSLAELDKIYRGKVTTWPGGEKITVINRESTASIRVGFYKKALNAEVNERFFLPRSDLPFKSAVLSSSALVKQVVKTAEGAIGYIYLNETDDTIKILKIDGLRPGEEGYKLTNS